MKRLNIGEIFRYIVVGGVTTAVSLGLYWICVVFFLNPDYPVQLQIANVISWVGAVTFAFFANRIVVFNTKSSHIIREAASFYFCRVGTLLMDMALMFFGVTLLHFNDKLVKIFIQIVVTIANYIISKFFIFKR